MQIPRRTGSCTFVLFRISSAALYGRCRRLLGLPIMGGGTDLMRFLVRNLPEHAKHLYASRFVANGTLHLTAQGDGR